ncbi:hypothetical protein L21SP2_3067 [Salinispira pacifica]|uniref:Lcl C-terminal domain-containing protein n=2 Tax=Salinispira pacifica TaxID=1307761 RepID=V5WML8_9SPIO|nr:hypothetical protein L21SP2_3067 [Salinispira pacifica]
MLPGILAALMLISACVIADGDPPDEPGSEALIASFILASTDNPGLSADVEAEIRETAISAELPQGSDRSSLVPSITTSEGASIDPASGEAADFSSTVTYSVTAEDGVSSTDYEVTFSVATGSNPGGGSSYPAVVMGTGQNYSYFSGDDGDMERGVNWPEPRFTDNGDGTITDELTGLMWEQVPSNQDGNTLEGVIGLAAASWTGGHNDWRVPNIREFRSLFHAGEEYLHTWLETQGFSGLTSIGNGLYFTSSYWPQDETVIYLQHNDSSYIHSFLSRDSMGTGVYHWLVRGTPWN